MRLGQSSKTDRYDINQLGRWIDGKSSTETKLAQAWLDKLDEGSRARRKNI
jgi:hypothetical protein